MNTRTDIPTQAQILMQSCGRRPVAYRRGVEWRMVRRAAVTQVTQYCIAGRVFVLRQRFALMHSRRQVNDEDYLWVRLPNSLRISDRNATAAAARLSGTALSEVRTRSQRLPCVWHTYQTTQSSCACSKYCIYQACAVSLLLNMVQTRRLDEQQ